VTDAADSTKAALRLRRNAFADAVLVEAASVIPFIKLM